MIAGTVERILSPPTPRRQQTSQLSNANPTPGLFLSGLPDFPTGGTRLNDTMDLPGAAEKLKPPAGFPGR
jgi:hypothetical protein